jgi:hypothetical protein
MNCTCLKPVFDDMILLRLIGVVKIEEERNEEVGRPMLAWRTAPRDNIT